MEGGESKAQASWLDCHISPSNSKWLTKIIKAYEHRVREILKLMGHDDFLSKMFDHKRSDLADRYDHMIEEVHRSHPSQTRMQHLDAPDSNSPQVTQMLTPDHMSSVHEFNIWV